MNTIGAPDSVAKNSSWLTAILRILSGLILVQNLKIRGKSCTLLQMRN